MKQGGWQLKHEKITKHHTEFAHYTVHIFKVISNLLFCQPRVGVTSCFVYKVMGLTFHERINTPLIYKIEIAQVVARRITEPQRTFSRFESHWLLFFIYLFFLIFLEGGQVWFYYSVHVLFFSFYLFSSYYFFIIIPLTCIRYIYKNFCNNTSYCKFGNTREYERQKTNLRRQNLWLGQVNNRVISPFRNNFTFMKFCMWEVSRK